MFQRQSRQSFPARNIIFLAAAVLGFIVFMLQKLKQPPTESAIETHPTFEVETGEKRDTGLRPFETFYAMRDYPVFRPDVDAYIQALAAARRQSVAARPRGGNDGLQAAWTLQGPANIGARINTIAVDPTNQNIIYLGFSGGGVWKTIDGGQNWAPVFDDQNLLSIGHIVIDPNDPQQVYVGTGDPNISGYPFIGDGLYKSNDGGGSWQLLGLTEQRIVSKIVVQNNRVLAGTMGLPFERNNSRGLYQKAHNATTWQSSLFISDETGIIDLVASKTNPNLLYAAAWDRIRNNQESVVAGENARIWKSIDGGSTWTALEGGLPMGRQSRIGLAIDPTNDAHVLATYANEELRFGGLFETFDGGENWQENAANGLNYNFQSNFAWYFGKVRINPYNNQDIWILGVYSFRSLDGGQTWFSAADWQQGVHADHHDLVFLSATHFLLGTDGGLYRSTDNATTWARADNVPATQFYRVAHNPHQPEWYYGGAQDNGTVAGNAGMLNDWQHLFGGDGFQAVFHPSDPNILYYETQNGYIYGSTDGGNFDLAIEGIDENDRRHWDAPYLLSHHDENVMFTGTYRLYKGYGHLPFWEPITEDLTDGIVFGRNFHTISTIDESPLVPDLLYVGTNDGNVWRIQPNSQSSVSISAGLPDRYISSVRPSPNMPERVFVSQTGYRNNDFTPHLYRSDDMGNAWTPISGNLPNLAINDIQLLPGHQDSIIFVATDGGVYATLDGGTQWERLGTGMPLVPVYHLDINLAQKTLIAGSHARSIMTYPLDSLRIGENSSTFTPGGLAGAKLTVHPTMAATQTILTIENLKSSQSAEVFLSDMNGRILWQEQVKGFGQHRFPVDVESFAPGVYLVFARSNGKVWATKKIVVAR
jgi:photosystem II stability/assembly factor-like uncharacterized protein